MKVTRGNPITCVWETTMGCNMRCGHCGSSCKEPLPGELTTAESLNLIDMLADLGLKWVTLSGGEPLTRKDLPILVKALREKGIIPNIITNGWLLKEDLIKKLKDAGVGTLAISIDGTSQIHDKIRRPGAFENARKAFDILNRNDIFTACITTLSNENLGCLAELKNDLIGMGVKMWQLQIGLPMGNFKNHSNWMISPADLETIVDFCYNTAKEGKIDIYPADCLGYYDKKLMKVDEIHIGNEDIPTWQGCSAGVRSFGVLHNGDIVSCTSIRDKNFSAGNIRERTLREIWEDPNSFTWRKNLCKSDLTGECRKCKFGELCLGGCTNTRLTLNGGINSENEYCTLNYKIKKMRENLKSQNDAKSLCEKAYYFVSDGRENFQEANILLDRALEICPDDIEFLKLKGFTEYKCGNYKDCENFNRRALSINENDYRAIQGLGLALHAQNKKEEAISLLKRAAQLTHNENEDVLNDLNFVIKC